MKYLLVIMGLLKISDGILTELLVGDNLVQEANSLMVSVIQGGNFLVLKITGALICVLVLWRLHRHFPRLAVTATSSIVAFYAAVMAWNTSIFFST